MQFVTSWEFKMYDLDWFSGSGSRIWVLWCHVWWLLVWSMNNVGSPDILHSQLLTTQEGGDKSWICCWNARGSEPASPKPVPRQALAWEVFVPCQNSPRDSKNPPAGWPENCAHIFHSAVWKVCLFQEQVKKKYVYIYIYHRRARTHWKVALWNRLKLCFDFCQAERSCSQNKTSLQTYKKHIWKKGCAKWLLCSSKQWQ